MKVLIIGLYDLRLGEYHISFLIILKIAFEIEFSQKEIMDMMLCFEILNKVDNTNILTYIKKFLGLFR